jgi:large subunit ribosomal protein L7Ae
MAKAGYVDAETPKEVQEKALQAVEMAKDTGRLRKGINEATKAIEKAEAVLVLIAEDVDPPEIVVHLPMVAKEKKVPHVFVSEKKALGKAAGLEVPCSAIVIEKAGSAGALIEEISGKLGGKKEKPAKKEAPAAEEKKEETKEKKEEKAEAAPAEEKKEKPKKAPKAKAKKEEEKKE